MGLARLLSAAMAAAVLSGCGGGAGHRSGVATRGSVPAPATGPSSAHAPPAYARHLLQGDELAGFVISHVSVYATAGAFVSSEQLSPAASAAETRMLIGNGFRAAVEEDLNDAGVAGLSLVERFADPAGARRALRFYVAKFHRIGASSGEFALFEVTGVPGAVGFRLGSAGAAGSNVAFAEGAYYYLLGEEGSGPVPQGRLRAAARRLYQRVHA